MLYQAIVTKYIGPTNTRGPRIKATAAAGSITVAYDCSINVERNHVRAAEALANKFKWRGAWFAGGLPDGNGNAFVCGEYSETAAMCGAVFFTRGED